MELSPTSGQSTYTSCENCKALVVAIDSFCHQCGFPVNGTMEEKQRFHYQEHFKRQELERNKNQVQKGRNSLFLVGGLLAALSIYFYFASDRSEDILGVVVIYLVLAAIFVMLGFWCESKPIAALISGLSLFVVVELLTIILDPSTINRSIIFKVFVIIYLVRALQSAFETEKVLKSNKVK